MGTGTDTFVQMGTSINGENVGPKNGKCPGGRKEFWRHKKRKMKRVCCCFGFLLLLNLFVSFCVLFHTGAVLHEVHELKEMDSKSFCSSFCMDFCQDDDCDVYSCRDLCQSNVESTLGSMSSSSSGSSSDSDSDSDEDEETVTQNEEYVADEDTEVEENDDNGPKLGGDEDYQQHGETEDTPKLGGDEDYQQHGTTTQEDPQQVSSNSIVSGTDSLPAPGDDTTEETTEDDVEDVDESTTGRGEGGRRHHRPNGQGDSEGGRQHGRGDGGRHHGKNGGGARFKRFRH